MTLTDWPGLEQVEMSPVPHQAPEMTVSMPPFEKLVRRWNEIAPLLEKATSRTLCYEPIDLLVMAATGHAGIWLCMRGEQLDAAIVTQVTVYPRRKVYEVLFGGGRNMKGWLEQAVEAFDRHARELGCSHVASSCRPGWARAWGARPTGDVILVREI
jgi:hypothetical protein